MHLSINPTGIAGFFETRIRQARIAHQHAKLRRELARLPSYVVSSPFELIQLSY